MKNLYRAFGLVAALSFAALAGPALADTIAITGATVHTAGKAGVLSGATVLITDGKISAIGKTVAVPAGARTIDARGKHITPGIVDAGNRMGLVEIAAARDSVDGRLKDYDLGAGFQIFWGINPDSTVIPVNRIEGVTRAIVAPSMGDRLFAGQGAVIRLSDGPDIVTERSVAVFARIGAGGGRVTGGSRAAALGWLREALLQARHYEANKARYFDGQYGAYGLGQRDLEALVPVARGKKILAVAANRSSDILNLLAIAKEFGLRLVILDGAEAWRVADRLAAAKVPVVINPQMNLPSSFDGLARTLGAAATLAKAGVTVAFGSQVSQGGPGGTFNARLLTQLAGNAVAYGMDHEAAIAAITANPARIFGQGKRFGAIEKGLEADVVVWNGDPLEFTSAPEHVFIAGREVPLTSRQTRLRDRYWTLGAEGLPPAYH